MYRCISPTRRLKHYSQSTTMQHSLIVLLPRTVYTWFRPISAPAKLLNISKPVCTILSHLMPKVVRHTCCNFASYIIRSGRFMVMIRITIMYESMFRCIVNFFGAMASMQAYLCVAVAINNVNQMESIHKANYFVRQVNSNQERLLPLSLILMEGTGIPSIP